MSFAVYILGMMHAMGFEPMSAIYTADLKSAPLDQLGHACSYYICDLIFKWFFHLFDDVINFKLL